MYLMTGANLFGQWLSPEPCYNSFQAVLGDETSFNQAEVHCITWSYNILKLDNSFYISGSWKGQDDQFVQVNLPPECKTNRDLIMTGNDYNLILVDVKMHTLWLINLESQSNIKKVKLIEAPLSNEIPKRVRKEDVIIKAIATNTSCLCLTSEGLVYSGFVPSLIDTSHCEGKAIDIQCGYEHFVILTDNGKVYTWGNGRRLQLGHGDIDNLDSPTEVEALAGLKIIKVSTGGWHSLALSEFGDIYAWGWNDTGQLGLKPNTDVKEQSVLNKGGIKSFPLPTVVDILDENGRDIALDGKDIACGSRHSAILLEDNSVWTTGFNKYGQLGFSQKTHPTVSFFKKSIHLENYDNLICGPWSTVLFTKKINLRKSSSS